MSCEDVDFALTLASHHSIRFDKSRGGHLISSSEDVVEAKHRGSSRVVKRDEMFQEA